MMSLPKALPSGTVIGGHYIIGDLINSGGFGAVYRGVDTSENHRLCAIKETYDVTPTARRQALMEASVLFTVRSPHLPEVYDALEANGRFYLVMQLIEGQNLLQLLKSRVPGGVVGEAPPQRQTSGPCTEQEVLSWLLPIMDILQELHSRNPPIIHRDIKPGNIILTPHNTTVLVDFGLTKLYDPAKSSQTMVKAVSEGFSPLEQYVGKTSPQSDIYSMGATMYLLLTNRLPPAAVHRTMRDELLSPRQLNATLSPKIERVLLKALAINAVDRFQSMRAFAAALREPAFDGYSDATVTVPSPPTPPMKPTGSVPTTMPGYPFTSGPPQHGYYGVPPVQVPPVMPSGPAPHYYGAPYTPTQAAPLPFPYVATPAEGGTAPAQTPPEKLSPTEPLEKSRPKRQPSPSNQGCLWGVIQGIACGLLALTARQPGDVFLPIVIGYLFYMLAGYITTRRGGSSFRGGWAGYWTGIWGTTLFWTTFGIGLAVNFVRAWQAVPQGFSFNETARQAWDRITPVWPTITLLAEQPVAINVLAWLGAGIIVAWILGWIGGILGANNYRARKAQKKSEVAQPISQMAKH